MCGVRDDSIQQKLHTEGDHTIAKAQEIAMGVEATKQNTKEIKGSAAQPVMSVQALKTSPKPSILHLME